MPFGLTKKQIEKLIAAFAKHPEIKEVIVFGSRAMENFKKGSDVDLALKGKIEDRLVRKISSELNDESTLPYIFDVFSYGDISNTNLKTHIDQFGKRLYHRKLSSR